MSASFDTLFLPLDSGDVPSDGRTLVIGAQAHSALKTLNPDIWQPFKPLADGLTGFNRLDDLPQEPSYDLVLVHVPKQVDEAKHLIAAALYALKPDGWLVLAAANDANGNRLPKWMKELGLPFESGSKHKARVVWARKPDLFPDLLDQWHIQGQKKLVQIGDGYEFLSQPGLFGWDKIDQGSQLLAEQIPSVLKGIGADFGAGTGYLSRRILERCAGVGTLYLVEADARALMCAKENLENVRGDRTLEFLWADLTKPAPLPPLDFIVMNPPFHSGKTTEAGIGQAFIETAACALKKGGVLYVVANAHLPYEHILQSRFTRVQKLAESGGFKIYEAQK